MDQLKNYLSSWLSILNIRPRYKPKTGNKSSNEAREIEINRRSILRPFLKSCTFFILPSYREGTPRSTLEALAFGRPIITTNVPGCKETVINGRNGYMIKPRDVGALQNAMIKLINTNAPPINGTERSWNFLILSGLS